MILNTVRISMTKNIRADFNGSKRRTNFDDEKCRTDFNGSKPRTNFDD